MVHVTLKQLKYFDALSRELHFGRAAGDCAVTQPALSMQIQELEQQLGVVLVERTRSGVMLTEKGREIAQKAGQILCDVRDLVTYAQHANHTLSGPLHLGVIPSVAPYLLPPLLPLVRAEFPELELFVRETQTHQIIAELADGKLDVLLLALPLRHPDIETQPLFNDRFVLALPKTRKISARLRATNALIAHERLLLLEEGHCLRDQALAYCDLRQVSSVNTFGASSLSTIVEMVAAGFGVTLLPEICLSVETRGRDLNLVRFVEPEPLRVLGLAWRASSPRKHDFKELARLIKLAGEKSLAHGAKLARGAASVPNPKFAGGSQPPLPRTSDSKGH